MQRLMQLVDRLIVLGILVGLVVLGGLAARTANSVGEGLRPIAGAPVLPVAAGAKAGGVAYVRDLAGEVVGLVALVGVGGLLLVGVVSVAALLLRVGFGDLGLTALEISKGISTDPVVVDLAPDPGRDRVARGSDPMVSLLQAALVADSLCYDAVRAAGWRGGGGQWQTLVQQLIDEGYALRVGNGRRHKTMPKSDRSLISALSDYAGR